MKRGFLLVLSFVITSFFSCKKDRVCECTITTISANTTITSTKTITYEKITKSDAKDVCSRYSDSYSNGNNMNGSYTSGCQLK